MANTSLLPHLSSRERLTLRRAADERLIDSIFGELFIVHRDHPKPNQPGRPGLDCPGAAAMAAADAEHLAPSLGV